MADPDALVIGRLRDHGEAPHEFRPRAEPSYYLKVETDGREQTFWSPALKRAMTGARTRPQIGDEIGIRQIEITPPAAPRSPGSTTLTLPNARTYWVVERSGFFLERADAAKALRDPSVPAREAIRAHPDLLGAYFALDSARKVAEARIGSPESREKFLTLVRETLAHATERGEPLPSSKLRAPAKSAPAAQPAVRRRGKGGRAR